MSSRNENRTWDKIVADPTFRFKGILSERHEGRYEISRVLLPQDKRSFDRWPSFPVLRYFRVSLEKLAETRRNSPINSSERVEKTGRGWKRDRRLGIWISFEAWLRYNLLHLWHRFRAWSYDSDISLKVSRNLFHPIYDLILFNAVSTISQAIKTSFVYFCITKVRGRRRFDLLERNLTVEEYQNSGMQIPRCSKGCPNRTKSKYSVPE